MVKLIIAILIIILLGWFFSIRILNSPLGLTADEGAFGLNATLLSRTGYDENGIKLPLFVLSLDGTDWRQPVAQYYYALFFKIFGASVFNLRFSSVIITLISVVLLYALSRKLFGDFGALVTSLIFVTTPLIMIHSHMGLDNIIPVPFTLGWLISLYYYEKTGKKWILILSAMCLGFGFYSYKGMRATSSIWSLVTIAYVLWNQKKQAITALIVFLLALAPFYLAIPMIEKNYPGAIFDEQNFKIDSIYTFLYPYFSSFDVSFLFISGDATPWHSTGKHGMLLLASFPFFVIGIWEAIKKKRFWMLILVAFFTAPLLYGLVNSVHRASRLMSIIPMYSLIAGLGAMKLWQYKKVIAALIVFLMLINYADFTYYYWYKYPELTRQWFGDLSVFKDYESLVRQAKKMDLVPYVDTRILGKEGMSGKFYAAAYLRDDVLYFLPDDVLEPNGILLTEQNEMPGLKKLEIPTTRYKLYTN